MSTDQLYELRAHHGKTPKGHRGIVLNHANRVICVCTHLHPNWRDALECSNALMGKMFTQIIDPIAEMEERYFAKAPEAGKKSVAA